jgi:hypothetical protein
MAKNPLFSTYRQGENRVTSSMLAVFERIDLSLLEALASASGESSLQMVSFVNQPLGRGASVPDGRNSARFAYWFEVKTTRSALRTHQLHEHLASLESRGGDERLFVVTPDGTQPNAINEVGDNRVTWFSFAGLSEAIDTALGEAAAIVPEQARFLLRELQALLAKDGLLDTDDVVVIAARDAYTEYLQHAAYVCQPGRAFREGLTHMGFYARGAIREVPRIEYQEDDVVFTIPERNRRANGGKHDRRIGELIATLVEAGPRQLGETYQVFLLSAADDSATIRLKTAITNDTVAASGHGQAGCEHAPVRLGEQHRDSSAVGGQLVAEAARNPNDQTLAA